jgi:hypothetical protein
MVRLALTSLLFTAAVASAQLTFPVKPTPGYGLSVTPPDYDRDAAMWNGPFVAVQEDPSVYRTFATGSLGAGNREIKPGAILIGLEITMRATSSSAYLTSVQATYQSMGNRVTGGLWGTPQGPRTQILARPNYAIRSVRCGANNPINGIQVVFAKIKPDGLLDPGDTYSSALYGAVSRTLDGGGLPFCGIGINAAQSVSGLSLLVSQPLVQSLQPTLMPALRNQPAAGIPGVAMQPSAPAANAPIIPGLNAPVSPTAPPATPPAPIPGGAASTRPTLPGVPPTTTAPTLFPTVPPIATIPALEDPASIARGAELVREASENLVFVESPDGKGSGFVCKMNGKNVLVTNQHVIAGNPAARFTTLGQTVLKPQAARAAAGHDLIAYDSPGAFSAFEMETDVLRNVSVGDPVVVLGNTEGASVIKPLHGKVVAIGPNLIEISNEFMPGNSGSPIVHLKSGKVVGVATYAIIRNVDTLTKSGPGSVRRFGYRLDSVQQWQPVDWATYQAEAASVGKVSAFSQAVMSLLIDLKRGPLNPARYTDARLKAAIAELAPLYTRTGVNIVDRKRFAHNFLRVLRNSVQRDVEDLKTRLRYDYFQREIAEEAKFRSDIYKGLGEAMGVVDQ